MTLSHDLEVLGLPVSVVQGGDWRVASPIDGREIARVRTDTPADVEGKIAAAAMAFHAWRAVPAPKRGELIRLFGQELRQHKEALGRLVTLECGKIYQEGLGEVQEMIDICDFAVGLSRQLYGLTIASERPGHRMSETWHPLGPVGIISAFNFPVAVWAWNAALAVVCGNPVIWKPSEKTPVTALATQALFMRALHRFGDAPEGLSSVIIGGREAGEALARDARVPLVSATGSTRMGRALAPVVAARFGRALLELGGNNAMIVTPSADLKLAERAILFAAVGTAGQRCTTLRRLIVHQDRKAELLDRMVKAYGRVKIGNPLEAGTLVGPLIDRAGFEGFERAIAEAKAQGGKVLCGGTRVMAELHPEAFYVTPAIIEMPGQSAIVQHETFAPILYVLTYRTWEEAMALQNGVAQGLSSCVFTRDVQEAERFVGPDGSDCGIANVNIGPSGAEIGGAFGGEKETGGGRESGSDSWKAYMRRQTATVNYSDALPLAQGIQFDA
ncbi:MAG TPA: aldehyde dehydrogenase family protein [Alphaproteobacteria bacterium]|nr:aldehyde dehydrogenase family protein [Alphaproteobacteria bacterium]HAJ45471.1 aldehyde dehydrogenase family protein [Alphaproteobacteria bacterium]